MDKSALFVFIEGSDGVGKTTIMNSIIKNYIDKELRISASHLIKHTRVGTAFYQDWTNGNMVDLSASLTMLGVTMATLDDIMLAKDNYDIILIDRSQASFYAYQLNDKKIRKLLLPAFEESLKTVFYKNCNFITIYLTCDSIVAKERMLKSRGSLDVIESKGSDYQDIVKNTYLECFNLYSKLTPACIIDTGINNQDLASKIAIDYIDRTLDKRVR